jgi:hypothetical protein
MQSQAIDAIQESYEPRKFIAEAVAASPGQQDQQDDPQPRVSQTPHDDLHG